MDAAATKVAREELNEPEDAASALAAFSASVVEALGAAEAERFLWAQKPTLRQCKWDTARALQKMRDLSAFAARRASNIPFTSHDPSPSPPHHHEWIGRKD